MEDRGVLITGIIIVVAICSFMFIIGWLLPETVEPANETTVVGGTMIRCPNPDCLYHDLSSVSDFEMTYDSKNGKLIYYCQRCRTQWEVER